MPSWINGVQGYREILDAADQPVQRRKTLQVLGATVTDNGSWTVVEVPAGATGAIGPTGATGDTGQTTPERAVLSEDFMAITPALATSGVLFGDRAPWTFTLIGGTADAGQRTTYEKHHPGQLIVQTGPTTGEWTLSLGDSAQICRFDSFESLRVVYRVSPTFATTIGYVGISNTSNTPANGTHSAWFEFVPATSANIRARTRDGSVDTSNVDTAVVIAGSTWYNLYLVCDPTTRALMFYINDVLVATTTAATHSIDAADQIKIAVYFKNGNAAVSGPVVDLIEFKTIATLNRNT